MKLKGVVSFGNTSALTFPGVGTASNYPSLRPQAASFGRETSKRERDNVTFLMEMMYSLLMGMPIGFLAGCGVPA
ncbi:hypothetical protein NPIL_525721 [Nephila pilipes]|uniref:Uncharacterized protein n=1 Tax=Nephila pilipes TaxID=299642 RepID=A0A8X6NIE6_NEPPI|nr:hypothetical protein NPIL_93141 [Nephila pilipes]GFT16563.1 hypothetical protein NPIL_525721 [Nephila pilipes]